MNRFKHYTYLCIGILIAGGASCSPKPPQTEKFKYSESRHLLGTIVKVDACYDLEQKDKIDAAYQKVWERIEDIHWRMSVFDDKSDVMRINNSYPDTVEVGADTYQLIQDSIHFSKVTHGVFEITVYPLIQLWKESEKKNAIPSREQIRAVQKVLGGANIDLMPNNQVRLLNKDAKIDLNSIAEGYAADEAGRILKEHGFQDYLVDAGGDLMAGGLNCEGNSWRIGIRDPRDSTKLIDLVAVTDASVTTSGNYEHYYEIQGQKWSHIMNPITGYPQTEVASATVIAPNAKVSDVLSTALCILSGENGIALIDSLGEGYASIVLIPQENGRMAQFVSSAYRQYKIKRER